MARHECRNTNDNQWQHCSVCNGRLHLPECTSRRDKNKDCCEARHRMLFEQGQLVGLFDRNLPMYDVNNPTWWRLVDS
jgi:hypothetical protein